MSMSKRFAEVRLNNKEYVEDISSSLLKCYLHKEGWVDTVVNKELIFPHRNTWYTPSTFEEKFHSQEFYELVIYVQGNVEYLNENERIIPSPYMITWFKPGQMHTTRLLSETRYERYVMCFLPDFFDITGKVTPIIDFIDKSEGTHMVLSENKVTELLRLLKKAEDVIKEDKPYSELLLKSIFVQIFYIMDSQTKMVQNGELLVDSIGEIKRYIDENYATIGSVSEIAERFYYSREHLSRKFVNAFNISIANYLAKRRITESLELLEYMSVAEVAYAVGYHSQSAFINVFKKYMNCLPSEYKGKYK